MEKYVKILFLSVIVAIIFSCTKIENYPEIPEVSFEEIGIIDSTDVLGNPTKFVVLSFIVKDGDGDIGLREGDTIGPYHISSPYYYNLFIKELEKKGDQFIEVSDTKFPRNYRIPYLTPEGQNKNLKATVEVGIEYSYNARNPLAFTIFKYEFYLVDRELQHSNIDTSYTIIF